MNMDQLKRSSIRVGWILLGAVVGSIVGMAVGYLTGMIVDEIVFSSLPEWVPNVVEDTREALVISIFATLGWWAGLVVGGLAVSIHRRDS